MITSAPAKIILSGEHAVVHGFPALAGALSLRLTVSTQLKHIDQTTPQSAQEALRLLQATVTSDIPSGSGLGSSAALSTAVAAAWLQAQGKQTTKEAISSLALQFEQEFHQRPSGIDTTTSTYGGLLWFRRESPHLVTRQPLELKNEPLFAIVHSGKPQETTAEMVSFVGEELKQRKTKISSLFLNIERCTRALADQLLSQKTEKIAEILNENGRLLEELGVVSPSTQQLLKKLRKLGFGCKVSGAGGRSAGSGTILVYHLDSEKYELLNSIEYPWDKVTFSTRGVEFEERT